MVEMPDGPDPELIGVIGLSEEPEDRLVFDTGYGAEV